MARASAVMRLAIGAACAVLTVAALPARLWKPQLRRLGLLALFLFVFSAIGSGLHSFVANHEICSHRDAPTSLSTCCNAIKIVLQAAAQEGMLLTCLPWLACSTGHHFAPSICSHTHTRTVAFRFTDGVPPRTQPRFSSPSLEGLQGIPRPSQGYRYVILHLWFITVTRRSISLGIATASLTFVALQVQSHLPCLLHCVLLPKQGVNLYCQGYPQCELSCSNAQHHQHL